MSAMAVGLQRLRLWLRGVALLALMLVALMGPAPAAFAASLEGLPEQPPANHVLDGADLLSRATRSEISHALDGLEEQGINATWVSLPRLDYGVSLGAFADQLLERWELQSQPQLLLLIDGQTSATAIVASSGLLDQLSPALLRSTARTTMAQPLREGNRYRQASLDAIDRLSVVLAGGPDPGEPTTATNPVATARVPSHEQTQNSNAFTWVAVLLVVGTVVPMLTWWVFSR